jgi:hypothetical protein
LLLRRLNHFHQFIGFFYGRALFWRRRTPVAASNLRESENTNNLHSIAGAHWTKVQYPLFRLWDIFLEIIRMRGALQQRFTG